MVEWFKSVETDQWVRFAVLMCLAAAVGYARRKMCEANLRDAVELRLERKDDERRGEDG